MNISIKKHITERDLLNFYYVLYSVLMIINNIVVLKITKIGGVAVDIGIIVMSGMYLITDVVNENYNKTEARKIAFIGFVMAIITQAVIYITYLLPALDESNQFNQVFDLGPRVIAASLITFLISQFIDIELFDKLKRNIPKQKWIRNNVSTIISRTIDTAIFYNLLFIGVMPYENILSIMLPIFPLNIVLSLLDTPIFYLLTKNKKTDINYL